MFPSVVIGGRSRRFVGIEGVSDLRTGTGTGTHQRVGRSLRLGSHHRLGAAAKGNDAGLGEVLRFDRRRNIST